MIELKQDRPLSNLKKEIKTHREIPGMNKEKDKWGQREKTAIFKPSRGVMEEIKLCRHLGLRPPASRPVRK